MPETAGVAGVLLAGGQSRRMGGGDKALRALGGRPLLAHALERAAPQVDRLMLNANGDPARFAGFDLLVVPDVVGGFAGPLAGVLTGMTWAAEHAPGCSWIATFACDAPFFPRDLVARLREAVAREGADMACAASRGRTHPVFGLWPVTRRDELERAMRAEGIRKVDAWTGRYRMASVPFEIVETPQGPCDPFFNTNHPADLAEAARFLPDA
jgi:molybdopterin-guanine dinucleotide biosynthesis protein A